ncbi:MAG: MaoC family dehydratase [Alphaproteobacteria bacterium]|jgi:3-hydroxybutyryl-CoA dehydratase|nr:MaoC family dehydratase [Alphaproteobacteria bacterium]MDP6588318.1 MaoC family dehydratase [Alphaproteobacteria bacterium]MDP6816818.1 MaoC family dehydratase [Alphaproteobacteria bacterium]
MQQAASDGGLTSHCFEDLEVGMRGEYRRVISQADVELFARVSGDVNPLHLDPAFAGRTMFEGRIVHGMYSAAMISTVIGTRLPGPGCVYMSQNLRFLAPVRAGDEVVASAEVIELFDAKRRARLETLARVGETVVVSGEALILVPTRAQLKVLAQAG